MATIWFRIDNRLIHGQVIEAWIPYLRCKRIIVVNDVIAEDVIQQQIMQIAIPSRIKAIFCDVTRVREEYLQAIKDDVSTLFLFAHCNDAAKALEDGVPIELLNIGNLHYSKGKLRLCCHVAVSQDDIRCLDVFLAYGTELDFRSIPDENPTVAPW